MNVFDNVQQELKTLIPSSILNDVTCFVLYDNHPTDEKNIDITVYTKYGVLTEYFKRDLRVSLDLKISLQNPSELRIVRNNNSELFYLLATSDVLFIISSKEKLEIHRKITNVERYEVNDTACSGEICLKVIKKDDAVPILFDSNFQCIELGNMFNTQNSEESYPVLNELKRKLVEARYTAKCNEKTYAHYLNLHQKVSLLSCQYLQTDADNSVFQDNLKNRPGALKLKTCKPWVKVCNNKIVVVFNTLIQNQESLESIHILLNTKTSCLIYTTRIFIKLPTSPYWQEVCSTTLKHNQECAITGVINLDEFKQNVTRIELSGSIAYSMTGQVLLVPFEEVVVSSIEVLEDAFEVLSSNNQNTVIAVLASTEKTEMCFRHIKRENEPDDSILDLFCTHLNMEKVENTPNVIVYRKSPYHALNGTMIIFHAANSDNAIPVSVHTRSPSQVLTLLHSIHDAVPAKIIHTTPSYKITSKTDDLSHYNEEISYTNKHNYTEYATSMLNRSYKILEHLDNSMIKMNESKNPSVLNKVGTHIDLFAEGKDSFKIFKESMNKEAKEAVESLMNTEVEIKNVVDHFETNLKSDDENSGSDIMYID